MLCVGVGVIERLTDRSNETETRGGGGVQMVKTGAGRGLLTYARIRVCGLFVPTCVMVKAYVGWLMGGWVWVRQRG